MLGLNLCFTLKIYSFFIVDVTVENLESVNDTALIEVQESGSSAKKQAGHKTGPPLRYSFSMSHCEAFHILYKKTMYAILKFVPVCLCIIHALN